MHNLLQNRKGTSPRYATKKVTPYMKLKSSTSGLKRTRTAELPMERNNTIASSDDYPPMDNPELFMTDRERRLIAMDRAVKARDKNKKIK